MRHSERKKIIEEITREKCKENYLSKLEAEITKIQAYNVPTVSIQDLLSKLEEDEKYALEGLHASKYFEAKAMEDIDSVMKTTSNGTTFFLTDARPRTSLPSATVELKYH